MIGRPCLIAIDLGQPSQPTALALLEAGVHNGASTYAVRHLVRWQPGTPYHEIAVATRRLIASSGAHRLVIDRTGVGRAATSLFRDIGTERPCEVTIGGGHTVTYGEDGAVHVPRKELIAVLQVLLQGRRITIASGLALADTLAREMAAFRYEVPTAATDTATIWREGEHDDLVLAVALATWHGERSTDESGMPLVLDGVGYGRSVWC